MTYRQRFARVVEKYMDIAREALAGEDYAQAAVSLDTAYEFARICELGVPDIDRESAPEEEGRA